jgi:hypothetical protein
VAGRRKGWNELSPSYRARLERQGVTADTYRSADLRAARGHRPTRSRAAAPEEPTQRASFGLLRTEDTAALERWRNRPPSRDGPPGWLPRGNRAAMGTDTMAILSEIRTPPSRWRSVSFTLLPDGRYRMTVRPRGGGYSQSVVLPDRDAMSESARFIRNPAGAASTPAERRRLEAEWRNAHPEVNVEGTK